MIYVPCDLKGTIAKSILSLTWVPVQFQRAPTPRTLRKLTLQTGISTSSTLTGSVVNKSVVDGDHLVEVQMQNNEQSGLATPASRAFGFMPLHRHRAAEALAVSTILWYENWKFQLP